MTAIIDEHKGCFVVLNLSKGIYHQFGVLPVRMLHSYDTATVVTTRAFYPMVINSVDAGVATISFWERHVSERRWGSSAPAVDSTQINVTE